MKVKQAGEIVIALAPDNRPSLARIVDVDRDWLCCAEHESYRVYEVQFLDPNRMVARGVDEELEWVGDRHIIDGWCKPGGMRKAIKMHHFSTNFSTCGDWKFRNEPLTRRRTDAMMLRPGLCMRCVKALEKRER